MAAPSWPCQAFFSGPRKMSHGSDCHVQPRLVRRAETAWVCAAVLAGVALRAVRIDMPEVNDDEAFSWRMAEFPWGEMLRRLVSDVHPPLYYMVLKGWITLFGPSPASIRGLSMVLGSLTIFVASRLAVRVTRDAGGGQGEVQWAGALAAMLVALSPAQITAGRTARMYAMGVLLAASSSLALLGATRAGGRASWRWAVAGGFAGAFLLTHPYATFTAVALVAFVGSLAVAAAARGDYRDAMTVARGGLITIAVMLTFYIPWLPAQLAQVRAIWAGYWIPDITRTQVVAEASYFISGMRGLGEQGEICAAALGLAILAAILVRFTRGRWLLFLLVTVPWVGAVGVSALGRRSIFLGRYLTFAHLFYLVGLGVAAASLRSRTARTLLAVALVLTFAYEDVQSLPTRQAALRPLVRDFAAECRPGQLLLASTAGTCLQFQYYTATAGSPEFPLEPKVVGTQARDGNNRVHGSAITEAQWVASEDLAEWKGEVAWAVGHTPTPIEYPAHWRVDHRQAFGNREERPWYLVRYQVERTNGRSAPEPAGVPK